MGQPGWCCAGGAAGRASLGSSAWAGGGDTAVSATVHLAQNGIWNRRQSKSAANDACIHNAAPLPEKPSIVALTALPAMPDSAPPPRSAWFEGRDPTRFVLVNTSHPGNVGATARAMKVMGFCDLVLVAPRFADVLSREETVAMASGAADILAHARTVATLVEALDGIEHVCATAMTPRDFGPPTVAPRQHFAGVMATAQAEGLAPPRLAFVFGSERYGMSNEDVYRSHTCLSIPTDPSYGSLNLAQAVQVVAYEWRQALGGFEVAERTAEPRWADVPAVQGVLSHWQAVLEQIGFLDPAAPKKLMPRLNQLLNRATLTQEEVHILRGMARQVQRVAGSPALETPTEAPGPAKPRAE